MLAGEVFDELGSVGVVLSDVVVVDALLEKRSVLDQGATHRKRTTGACNRVGVGIERNDACGVTRDSGREASVAAAHLEHPASPEVTQPPQCGEVGSLRVENRRNYPSSHARGLYALSVVPRAPNFCALRRVSSNVERA